MWGAGARGEGREQERERKGLSSEASDAIVYIPAMHFLQENYPCQNLLYPTLHQHTGTYG